MAIKFANEPLTKRELLSILNPLVAEWFSQFDEPTPPQSIAIPLIQQGKNVLIASPTGSGKTLAAFLSIISSLTDVSMAEGLKDEVYCIYVSPLRALSNDVKKNLLVPLEGIDLIAEKRANKKPSIRVGLRTGDTTQSERTRMLIKPPHILITTPESLAIMLTAPKFREKIRNVRWIILDEIHEICSSKRGVHLSLSLERLGYMCRTIPARIGLSATIHPLEDVARYLVGYENCVERDCFVVDARFVKPTKLTVTSPSSDLLSNDSETLSSMMYKRIASEIKKHRTVLVFTNTRSGAERVAYKLSRLKVVDLDKLAAHHSSLSREIRLDVEDRLKKGSMRVVVTSTSLELGIDIGSIDLVIQIGSPKSISRCLQRVGRSGHALDKVSKGLLVALERDDLIEDCVIANQALRGKLDRVYIPKNCLDVLAQHVVGMALENKWSVKEAYQLVKRSYCYSTLPFESFLSVLRYLSGMYGAFENYRVYGKIWYDETAGTFGKRGSMLRVIYSTNIGTIPDEVAVRVYDEKNRLVGMIEEEFLERLARGDVFTLGGRVYKFRHARGFKAFVNTAEHEKPTVPSWFSEMLPLSFDLGEAIGNFRAELFKLMGEKDKEQIVAMLVNEYSLERKAASAILNYLEAEMKYLKSIGIKEAPDNRNIIVENYFDELGRQNVIFNCVFGRRTHDALSRAYADAALEMTGKQVLVVVLDSCFSIILPKGESVLPSELVKKVTSSNIRERLLRAVRRTEIVKRRFRHCSTRALMVLRNYRGHEISVTKQQLNSQILMNVCERFEKFPVLQEAYREVIEDVMDVYSAESVLKDVENGTRKFILTKKLDVASPFTHELLVSGYTDVVLMEDKRVLLNSLYRSVMKRLRDENR
jgi:ATP-dependent Lhr-like helicase